MSTIKLHRDTATNWTTADPTLATGEPGFETDTGKFKIGDGVSAWTALPYAGTAHLSATEGVQLANNQIKADISGLSEKVSPSEVTDYLFAYDSSAAGHRKIKIGNLPGGGGKVS
ncbi:MAG: hypothetical protein PHI12_14515, partial [Dehalococcoidales bacterium]|nr:hypothetical protein [Dehalococcoidales bacterium]